MSEYDYASIDIVNNAIEKAIKDIKLAVLQKMYGCDEINTPTVLNDFFNYNIETTLNELKQTIHRQLSDREEFIERNTIPNNILNDIIGKSLEEMFIKYKPLGYFILEENGKEIYRPNTIRVIVDNGIITSVVRRG